MRIRKCWVESCDSSADREEDKGVTYHKLPKDDVLRAKWLIQSKLNQDIDKKCCLICSRHFRRVDFEPYKASVFTLKSDAIPTIFPWGITRLEELNDIFSKLDIPNTSTNMPDIETCKSTESSELKDNLSVENKSDSTNIATVDSSDSKKSENDNETDDSTKNTKEETKKELQSPKASQNENLDIKDMKSTTEMEISTNKHNSESINAEIVTKTNTNDKKTNLSAEIFTKTSSTEASDSCGKESEESQSDSDQKNCDTQENPLPEIETILENIFGPDDISISPTKNENTSIETSSKNNPLDPHKSLRDILSQPIKQITKLPTKLSNVGRPKRTPSTSKTAIKTKSKTIKQKPPEKNDASEKNVDNIPIKQEKGLLVQGARVEAKDFNDIWYPAKVIEVDHDEMEVLIHYDNWSQRFDEWIYMWSPRIRVIDPPPPPIKAVTFKEGERCLARWSNNQRFPAKVQKVLPNGQYEVVFDDGFVRVTKSAMMSKITAPTNRGTAQHVPSVQNSELTLPSTPTTPVHNHLFDPQRDHLGTKEERRSLKKKIDIKELFLRKKKKIDAVNEVKSNETPKEGRGRKRKVKSDDETPLKDLSQKIKKKETQVKTETESLKQDTSHLNAAGSPKATIVIDKLNTSILSQHLTDKTTNFKTISSSSPVSLPVSNKNVQQIALDPPVKPPVKPNTADSITIQSEESILQSTLLNDDLKQISPLPKSPNIQSNDASSNIINSQSPTDIPVHIILKSNNDNLKTANTENRENSVNSKGVLPQYNVRAGDKDWCCRWVNDQPVGTLVETESQADRITFQVLDHRLPSGWKKLLTKKHGTESTKWDVVLICPSGRRYRTRGEMNERLKESDRSELEPYVLGLLDFSAHRKQARRKGWDVKTSNFPMSEEQYLINNKKSKKKSSSTIPNTITQSPRVNIELKNSSFQGKDFIYVGSLKVQVIENLLRCPKEGCFKNFRKDNLLQMHIKHYHPEMCKFFGDTPNVADLAYARIVLDESSGSKNPIDRYADVAYGVKKEVDEDSSYNQNWNSPIAQAEPSAEYQFSQHSYNENQNVFYGDDGEKPMKNVWSEKKVICNPDTLKMKFFSTKPDVKRSHKKKVTEHGDENRFSKKKRFNDNMRDYGQMSDFDETRSSFGMADQTPNRSFEHNVTIKHEYYQKIKEEKDDSNQSSTIVTESGERIKIVHMKREEIINCHCGFGEEDGLMIQCELCLCWQHALCHNIEKESEVPDKYVCLICLQPYRGRKSQKHLHAQEWLYEGRLPKITSTDSNTDIVRANLLKKSHELTANLLQLKDLMHSLRCKIEVAEKKDHPKLYLWSKPWENETLINECIAIKNEENVTIKEESDVCVKENDLSQPAEKLDILLDASNIKEAENIPNPSNIESQTDGSTPANIFSNLLVSPGGTALELPITNSELETLANTVQISAPQPEAAIESSECRVRLLQHIERTQLLLEARLDSIEAQIAELESQDPSTGDDETPDHYPRTKQTIQMLLRDLSTLEELGTIC